VFVAGVRVVEFGSNSSLFIAQFRSTDLVLKRDCDLWEQSVHVLYPDHFRLLLSSALPLRITGLSIGIFLFISFTIIR